MTISKEEVSALLGLVASSKSDASDCDDCFSHLAEFAEAELLAKEIPEALLAVKRHLEQCACCKDEHDALLEGLKSLE